MDYIISGISEYNGLEQVVKEMFEIDSFAPISKIIVWDKLGKTNQSLFHEDLRFSCTKGIIEFQYDYIDRISFLLGTKIGEYKKKIEISFHLKNENVIVEGQLYLDKFIAQYSNSDFFINDFSKFLIGIVKGLKLTYINVSDEDNESLIVGDTGVFLPNVFSIFKKQLLIEKIKKIDNFCPDKKLIPIDNEYFLIIINSDF